MIYYISSNNARLNAQREMKVHYVDPIRAHVEVVTNGVSTKKPVKIRSSWPLYRMATSAGEDKIFIACVIAAAASAVAGYFWWQHTLGNLWG